MPDCGAMSSEPSSLHSSDRPLWTHSRSWVLSDVSQPGGPGGPGGKTKTPYAVSSMISSGRYEDDEDNGDELW